MDLTDRSRERVDDTLAGLREQYGLARVVEDRWPVDPETYDRARERFEAGTLGGAGAWVAREDGAVLLVREHDREGWADPGGKDEPGETLREAAVRETREEAGVDATVVAGDRDGVVLAERAVHVAADDDRPPLHRLLVVFAARHAGGEARAAEPGVAAARWFDAHPHELLYDHLAKLPVPAGW